MNWYVLYTKARNEKKVADRLTQLGVENYCPMVEEVKQWSDRKKKVSCPLFSSYVFVRLPEHERDVVFQVPGVVRYLFWLGKPAVVAAAEIADLQRRLLEGYQKVTVAALERGSVITLDSGYFKGQEAVVDEVRGRRVRVCLTGLGLYVVLERSDS
ncbi:UpxY family transcription antiterminator [Flavobacterium sp. HXWNR69]|uniref:UpxY family transcription antiterminator n=1 Tax=Flavobacterium fragile TaxID=2949085 RepID=A0ABT0TIC4_9FLAO|nr:UpxY family transcription antiterminator [Flavobacterium sp. HXWNR69]MCL9770704.1 UpxY family transcription antiterminator [Flavobacterium sp. HXWNR69]